jgi:serine/threonine protein kinase
MTTEFRSFCGEVANSYPLQNWLGAGGNSAVYSTVYGGDSQPAAIKLIQMDGSDWERQLGIWSETSRLSHPGLIRLLDSGHCEIQGEQFLYVVMERADGNLAEVLTDRSLTAAEAREMLSCTAMALTYLHEHGFVHGGVRPASIMAVGDQIKLATDAVVRADVGNPDDDVRSLGLTLVQALTQHRPDADAGAADKLSEPFREIVEHCLQQNGRSRWTASQIVSYLGGGFAKPLVSPSPAPRRSRLPLYWIAAVMIVITMIVLLLRSGPGAPHAPVPLIVSQAPIAATVPEEPAAPATLKQSEYRETRISGAQPNGTWYVVVATYARKEDAEKRAHSITNKWPRFRAEIYSPPDEPYHLVIIGSNLSQKAAVAVQQRAIAAGLPNDTYIQRLSE